MRFLIFLWNKIVSTGPSQSLDEETVAIRTRFRNIFLPRYALDERRVTRYLCDRAGIGGGADPVGFLIASHRFMGEQSRKTCEYLLQTFGVVQGADPIGDLIASHKYMLTHWTPPADLPAQPEKS